MFKLVGIPAINEDAMPRTSAAPSEAIPTESSVDTTNLSQQVTETTRSLTDLRGDIQRLNEAIQALQQEQVQFEPVFNLGGDDPVTIAKSIASNLSMLQRSVEGKRHLFSGSARVIIERVLNNLDDSLKEVARFGL